MENIYEEILLKYSNSEEEAPRHIVYISSEDNEVVYNGYITFGKKFGNLFAIAKIFNNEKTTVPFKILKEETIDISEETYTYYILKEIPCQV